MLDYIKQQLRTRNASVIPEKQVEDHSDPSEDPKVLLEYASIFQELADLTEDGTEVQSLEGRNLSSIVDIPMEDELPDIEIDSIELNLGDGRITDIPMDATVTEYAGYQFMKTFDSFVQETYAHTSQMPRETKADYDHRVISRAERNYAEYVEGLRNDGRLGMEKITLESATVPSDIKIDLGDIDGSHYMTKLPVKFESDNGNIVRKQLDSLGYVKKHNVLSHVAQPLKNKLSGVMNLPEKIDSIWNVVTPKSLMFGVGPADRYCCVLEYEVDSTGKTDYLGWSTPIHPDEESIVTESMQQSILGDLSKYTTKDEYVSNRKNVVVTTKPGMPSRFGSIYQEAIDFGGGDGGSDLPPTEDAGGGEAPPTQDAQPQPAAPSVDMAPPTEGGVTDTPPVDNGGGENPNGKEDVDTNNVSDQIAQKVSDQTTNDTEQTGITDPISDIDFDENSLDNALNNTTDDSEDVVNDKLADLDGELSPDESDENIDDVSTEEDEDEGLGMDPEDLDNMTIEDIFAQGSEKLKGMTINELKDFLADSGNSSSIQESMSDTSSINDKVLACFRDTKDHLNAQDNPRDLLNVFANIDGPKLNKLLNQAKDDQMYTPEESNEIKKLITVLNNAITSVDTNGEQRKDAMKEFNTQSGIVAKFMEEKGGIITSESVDPVYLLPTKKKVIEALERNLKYFKERFDKIASAKDIKEIRKYLGNDPGSVDPDYRVAGTSNEYDGTGSAHELMKALRKADKMDVFTADDKKTFKKLLEDFEVFYKENDKIMHFDLKIAGTKRDPIKMAKPITKDIDDSIKCVEEARERIAEASKNKKKSRIGDILTRPIPAPVTTAEGYTFQEAFMLNKKNGNKRVLAALNTVEAGLRTLVKKIEEKTASVKDVNLFLSSNLFGNDPNKVGTDLNRLSNLLKDISSDDGRTKFKDVYDDGQFEQLSSLQIKLDRLLSVCSKVKREKGVSGLDSITPIAKETADQIKSVREFVGKINDEALKNKKENSTFGKLLHKTDVAVTKLTGVDTPTAKAEDFKKPNPSKALKVGENNG